MSDRVVYITRTKCIHKEGKYSRSTYVGALNANYSSVTSTASGLAAVKKKVIVTGKTKRQTEWGKQTNKGQNEEHIALEEHCTKFPVIVVFN